MGRGIVENGKPFTRDCKRIGSIVCQLHGQTREAQTFKATAIHVVRRSVYYDYIMAQLSAYGKHV